MSEQAKNALKHVHRGNPALSSMSEKAAGAKKTQWQKFVEEWNDGTNQSWQQLSNQWDVLGETAEAFERATPGNAWPGDAPEKGDVDSFMKELGIDEMERTATAALKACREIRKLVAEDVKNAEGYDNEDES